MEDDFTEFRVANLDKLNPEQKFCILNSSICPSLIYTFQTTPLNKIPNKFIEAADKIIKSGLKEILQLPADIPDSMIYTHRKFKGLGLFRVKWESALQHINSLRILHRANDAYISSTRNLHDESKHCLTELKLKSSDSLLNKHDNFLDSRKIRETLRDREFNTWCSLQSKGRGVILFKEFPPCNQWITNHEGLSSSEWKDAIKMVGGVAPVRAVPGRSRDTNRCRRCLNEIETLAHVLGSCPHGENLRNIRHHTIRSILAAALRDVGFIVHEEVQGLATQGSIRRIDIIAIRNNTAYILDPTIRTETHAEQPHEVDMEKRAIYEPTIPYYKEKYHLSTIEVVGLMVGARGTIPSHFAETCKKLGLSSFIIKSIAVSALKGSVLLLRHHLYG